LSFLSEIIEQLYKKMFCTLEDHIHGAWFFQKKMVWS
jgi:hypothetical protein